MMKLAEQYPGYGFEDHKGYGGGPDHTHTIALNKLGMCAIHRRSYAPMRDMVKKEGDLDISNLGGDE